MNQTPPAGSPRLASEGLIVVLGGSQEHNHLNGVGQDHDGNGASFHLVSHPGRDGSVLIPICSTFHESRHKWIRPLSRSFLISSYSSYRCFNSTSGFRKYAETAPDLWCEVEEEPLEQSATGGGPRSK